MALLRKFRISLDALVDRLATERGEGVISAAIAILVIAFLGVAMWVAFDVMMTDATTTIGEQVEQIGNP